MHSLFSDSTYIKFSRLLRKIVFIKLLRHLLPYNVKIGKININSVQNEGWLHQKHNKTVNVS
jgi:hypothetical protein